MFDLHRRAVAALAALAMTALSLPAQATPRSAGYAAVQARLQHGWNSWDTHTVTGQVLLPAGLEIRLGVKRVTTENSDAYLSDALIGRQGAQEERVFPGPHAYDGSYSELRVTWRGVELELQTAHAGDDLVMLITPLKGSGETSQPG
ncbi:MAG: hypothetical protein ACXWKW_04515, partial [Asticcacaulis sp.]